MPDLIHATSTHLDQRIVVGTAQGLLASAADAAPTGRVTAVASGPNGVWTIVDGSELWHVDHLGESTVVRVADGGVRALAVDRDVVWVGGADATLWRVSGDTLETVASFATAPTRDGWYTPWGGPPDVFSIAAHDGVAYVNVHVGGVLRSIDGGASWAPTIDLSADVHDVAVDGSGTVWAATGGRGLVRSDDRGETWTSFTEGLHSTYAIAVAPTIDGALMFAAAGPRARDGQLYRLDGDRLVVSNAGLPASFGGTLWSAQLSSSGDDVALATPDGSVYISDDGGRRWSRAAGQVGATSVAIR